MEKKAGVVILKQFFGLKQGQTLKDFNDELKCLSPEDKMWMAQEAGKLQGVEVADPVVKAA